MKLLSSDKVSLNIVHSDNYFSSNIYKLLHVGSKEIERVEELIGEELNETSK